MEAITRKRKLNEIDTNIPINNSSIQGSDLTFKDAKKFIWKRLKQPKLITPSKGCENNVQLNEIDGEQTVSPKLSRSIKRDESVNKSVLRCHMKTCDRKYRKTQIHESKSDDTKLDFTLDVTPSEKISSLNVTVVSPSKISDESSIQKDQSKEKTVHLSDTKDMRILFASDYFEEIVTYEFERQNQFKLSQDYCKKYDIDPARREILIDWLISVQMHLKASNPTLHLAVSLLDTLLDSIYVPCDQLQVSAIAAFWVAFKFIEGNLSVKKLISLCAGVHGKDVIISHEMLVLKSSGFLQTGGNVSTLFIYVLFKMYGARFPPDVYYAGQFFLEIMMTHFVFIGSTASERAATAAYTSLVIFDNELRFKFIDSLRFITRKRLNILCCNLTNYLHAMYRDEEFMRSSNLFKKYKSSRYFKISVNKNLRRFVG